MFVCYNCADYFLHLCTETHESHTCLTLTKNFSIMEKPRGGGGTAIYGLYRYICAAVKGMVFKQFTLG